MSAPAPAGAGHRVLWRRYVPALAAALAVLAAGGAFQRVFTWHPLPGPLAAAALLGAAAGVVARETFRPRRGTFVPFLLVLVLLAVATVASAMLAASVFATPTSGQLGQGVAALVEGWTRILTTSVPVPPTADRLPLAAGLVALGTGWAVVAATRRTPGVEALVPAGLVLATALLLGVGGPGSVAMVAGPALVLAAAYLLLVSRPAGEGVVWVPPARVLAAIGTAVIVLAVGIGAGNRLPLATLRQPVDLHAVVSPPIDLSDTANPLDELPAWQHERNTVMFTATVDQAWLADPSNWQLASLDAYDGTGWSTDARATSAGGILRLPTGVSEAQLGPEVHVGVRLQALGGPWVPTTGVPTGVAPADLDFDAASSILVGPRVGPNQVYELAGRLSQPSVGALDSAGIGSGEATAALTAVPSCFPASLRSLATQATAGLARPDQLAVGIEQELARRGGFRLDANATPGSGCARLAALAKGHSGTAEQFATAFALMARSVGLPSRLAVGFTPGAIDRSAKRTVVTAADVTVWPEVDLGSLGWVTFSPLPSAKSRPSKTPPPTKIPAADRGLSQVRQSVAKVQSSPTTQPSSTPTTQPVPPKAPGGSPIAWPVLVVAGVVVVALALLLGRIAARWRRRARRRKAAEPAERILGAWAEVLDSLAAMRVPLRGLTPSEVSAEAGRAVPGVDAPSSQLAGLVDQAVYAGVADDGRARAAWAASDLTVRAVTKAMPPRQRIGALLAGPRSRPRAAV